MKIQCDVCQNNAAAFMCCADEAALCADCDTRVHAANKLASKHERIALINPSPESSVRCDICQEKTGHFFCLEDRALLCRNCDVSIHFSNAYTSNHKRFLVTGTRASLPAVSTEDAPPGGKVQSPKPANTLSPRHGTIPADSPSQATTETTSSSLLNLTMQHLPVKFGDSQKVEPAKPPLPLSSLAPAQRNSGVARSAAEGNSSDLVEAAIDFESGNQNASGAAFRNCRISDYFTETIPGLRVDEFLSISNGEPPGHHFGAIGSSKADPPVFGKLDWTTDVGFVEGQFFGESLVAEVPEMYCPYTSGVSRSSKGASKYKNWSELVLISGFDDSFIVPDVGSSFSPWPFPPSPPQKRSRTFVEM